MKHIHFSNTPLKTSTTT